VHILARTLKKLVKHASKVLNYKQEDVKGDRLILFWEKVAELYEKDGESEAGLEVEAESNATTSETLDDCELPTFIESTDSTSVPLSNLTTMSLDTTPSTPMSTTELPAHHGINVELSSSPGQESGGSTHGSSCPPPPDVGSSSTIMDVDQSTAEPTFRSESSVPSVGNYWDWDKQDRKIWKEGSVDPMWSGR
jgi:hypothetical protein